MGYSYKACCRSCGNHFRADVGGGRRWELLRCSLCGSSETIAHDQIMETVRNLNEQLRQVDLEDDFNRVHDEFRRSVETYAGVCRCGGRLTFDAPPRCPACSSTEIELGQPWHLYD
jgi:DNA-directed RNA polymerase subunit M/transcription elongation factor TFIIS